QERIKGTEKASPIHTLFHRSQGGLDNSQSHSANVLRVDDPRSEPRALHEFTRNKWRKMRRAILLFVLSTKTTTERFLLKLCQRNGI
ncbi:unnamed protein product, partial [Porites evermanni]